MCRQVNSTGLFATLSPRTRHQLGADQLQTQHDGTASAGVNLVRWDGRGENGHALPPGAYYLTLKAGERADSRKIVLFH